ncbi:MAG: low molecular weight phosphotyrosine protein phosphatase [Gallionella sp.]|jgi:protein-tyrosine phosphatase|nr:low molecular weight phosphotyrosine protein phosphatase [Gallionella sp.]
MIRKVLLVCVGNICRSPMAEGMLKNRAPKKRSDLLIHSAGLEALVGHSADPQAIAQIAQRGWDISTHLARQITLDMVREADLILTMEKQHQQHLHSLFPIARGKTHLLGKWHDREISDPYRKSPEFFAHIADQIEQDVEAWIPRIWRH